MERKKADQKNVKSSRLVPLQMKNFPLRILREERKGRNQWEESRRFHSSQQPACCTAPARDILAYFLFSFNRLFNVSNFFIFRVRFFLQQMQKKKKKQKKKKPSLRKKKRRRRRRRRKESSHFALLDVFVPQHAKWTAKRIQTNSPRLLWAVRRRFFDRELVQHSATRIYYMSW